MAPQPQRANVEEQAEVSWQSANDEHRRAQYGSVWPGVPHRQVPLSTMSASVFRQPGPGQVGLIMGKRDRFRTILNSASDLYAVVMHFKAFATHQRLQADGVRRSQPR